MIGSSSRRRSSNRSSLPGRFWAVGLAAVLAVGACTDVIAQSGRVRERKTVPPAPVAPAPTPSAQPPATPGAPSSPPPIPPGGDVVAQTSAGAIVRTELAIGTVLVVRENPASDVVAVLTAVRLPDGADPRRAIDIGRASSFAGTVSPAQRVASVGGMIDVAIDGGVLTFATSALGRDVDTVLAAHAAIIGGQRDAVEQSLLAADRTTVGISGRVNAYTVMTTVQREFGALSRRVDSPPPPAPANRSGGRPPVPQVAPPQPQAPVVVSPPTRYLRRVGAAGSSNVTISFDPVPHAVADGAVAAVLAAALGVGRTSRFQLALRESANVGAATARSVWTASGPGFEVTLAADSARLDDASATVWRELDRLRRERLSEAELQRARNQAELADVIRGSRPDDDVAELVRHELETRDVKASWTRRIRLRGVTAAEVQVLASRLFSLARASIVESVPIAAPARPSNADAYISRVAAWAPGIQREVAAGDVREGPPVPAVAEGAERERSGERGDVVLVPVPIPVRDFSTLNGPKAFVREDASQPVVAVGFFFPSGRAAETSGNRGITELTLRAMLRGSKGYPGDALLFGIERFGGRVRIVNEPDFFGFVVEMLSRNADLVMPVAIDLVEAPQLETVSVLGERDRLLADQRPSRVASHDAAVNLFWQGRYPTHSYGVAAIGLPETVAKLTDESVRGWYAASVRALYPLVGIVGDTDGSSLVSKYVVDGFDRPEGDRLSSPALPAPSPVSEVSVDSPEPSTVAAIAAITPGGSWDALEAIEIAIRSVQLRIGSSSAGASFQRISCGVERRRQAGAAICTVESPVAGESAARAAVLAEVGRTASAAWSAEEIEAGRRCATVAWSLSTSRCSDMAVAYVRASAFGLPLDTVERYGERVGSLPVDGIRRAAAAVLEAGRLGRGVVRGSAPR